MKNVTGAKEFQLSKPQLAMNIIVHLLLFGITFFITYLSFKDGVTLFSWHPCLAAYGVSWNNFFKNKQLVIVIIVFFITSN